ncbi:RDD family protein [Aeromicrobium terrae]|uniref:RDD family protein n=1 Tax=Aeromicrobium terrae TaxID=2498846 RepID=A0A5C8NNV4_9ACTN|nr:RDD family protein [Aeromicrobium terrae]TXL62777.1 RDD family protein [Aeromicrobium terrae]
MPHVSLGRRLVALLIDWVIAAFSAIALAGVSYPPDDIGQNLVITGFFVGEVALLTGLLGYSIGKRVVGLKVEGPNGRPIGVPRAILRTLLVCLVIPAVVMNDERRGLHDIAVTSRVMPVQ